MKMKKVIYHIAATVSACLLTGAAVSCQQPSRGPQPLVEKEMTLSGLSDDHWTYFSFESGETVGTSLFLSEEDDAAWSRRDDWDFAICGKYLKTNSGTSGIGAGGVLRDGTHNFLTLEEAPAEGYLEDEVQVTR